MLNELEAIESRGAILALSEGEVDALSLIGRELASTATWWGGIGSEPSGSVVSIEKLRDGRYRILFRDVIGLVRVGDKQIRIKPKIPMAHFSYIASHSDLAPRLSTTITKVQEGADLTTVVARWLIEAAERLLRQGVRKDYTDKIDEVDQVQGSLKPFETTLLTSMGVPRAVCSFQEFSEDTMLNRVVKAACLKVSQMKSVDSIVRDRARQVVYRMDSVSTIQTNDLKVRIERLTVNYTQLLGLSRLVLAGLGLTVAAGRHVGTAFLIRTPELIEDGLRSILKDGLQDIKVTKRRLMLGDSGLSINPDLVFGNTIAIADVKYRTLGKHWSKSDLNQVVTFATGFRTNAAAVLGFSTDDDALPRAVLIGDVKVNAFAWSASDGIAPHASADKFVATVRGWLYQLNIPGMG